MTQRNLTQKKIQHLMVWILTLLSLLYLAKGQSWASHSENTHSMVVNTQHDLVLEKNQEENVPHQSESHKTIHDAEHSSILHEENHHQTSHDEKHPENSIAGPEIDSHSAPVPFAYKLYWIGLILLVIFLLVYFLIIYKKEKFTSLKPLSILLLLLALSLYLLEQGKIFTGYFDPSAGGFVSAFHEPNTIGFLRFLYKLVTGIALGIYGFIIFFSHKSTVQNNRYEKD